MPMQNYNIRKIDKGGFLLEWHDEPEREVDRGDGLVPSRMKHHTEAFKSKDELNKRLSSLL